MKKGFRERLAARQEKINSLVCVGLGYTSNPTAREVQDIEVNYRCETMRYWEFIAMKVLEWSEDLGLLDNAGLVMAAAHKHPAYADDVVYSWHLKRARQIVGNKLWFLIPGIGTQGGFVEETVKEAFRGPGSIAINSSSGIIFASSRENYAEVAAGKAEELRDQIRQAGGDLS